MEGALITLGAIVVGGAAGAAIRRLLAAIPRGMVVRRGPTELAGAVVTVVGAAAAWGTPRLFLVLFAGLLLVALSGVDIVYHRLPDAITLPAVPVALLVVASTAIAVPGSGSVLRAMLCGIALWLLFGAVAWVSPRSMGRGDVKLVPTLGLITGFVSVPTAVVAVALAFVLGALVGLVALLLRRVDLGSAIPFGPFLLVGAWAAVALPGVGRLLG